LWHAFARLVRFGQRIAFEHSHFVVVISQCPSSQEAAHARADHDCMLAQMRHGASSLLTRLSVQHDTPVTRLSFNRDLARPPWLVTEYRITCAVFEKL
jgi:hypothetical protein